MSADSQREAMNVSSSNNNYEGMDRRIRNLSLDTAVEVGSSASPSFIMSRSSAQAVTPCPSDSSCCTDCGGSSSSSFTSMLQQPHLSPLHEQIPTEVQMTQKQRKIAAVPISPPSNNNTAATTRPPMSEADKRRHFLVLVQIILKCLQQDAAILNNAIIMNVKKVIRECTLKNKQGDPNFRSLVDAATPRLRKVVGEKTWARSMFLLRHYMQQQQLESKGPKIVPV